MSRDLNIQQGAIATVSVINASFLLNVPTRPYVAPEIPGHCELNVPCFVFLVENSEGRKVLFDLGTRKDWENLPPTALREISSDQIKLEIIEDVVQTLNRGGLSATDIEAAVLSHHHWDHVGDPTRFPDSLRIIVGPGFVETWLSNCTTTSDSAICADDFRNKEIVEIDFSSRACAQIGQFKGYDYFGDGSFYLVDAPGHSLGHIAALARTTQNPDSFVFMGADGCHHNGQMRPSGSRPLPRLIDPHPLGRHIPSPCPSLCFERYLGRIGKDSNTPFYSIAKDQKYEAYTHDRVAAEETIKNIQQMDGYDNVFITMAHDDSLLSLLDFFPLTINDWKARGLSEQARWAFLKDFRSIIESQVTEGEVER